MADETIVLCCGCTHGDSVPAEVREPVLRALEGRSGVRFVGDLCEEAERRSSVVREAAAASRLTIVACHPRAVRWLFHYAGSPLNLERVTFLNMKTLSPSAVIECLGLAPAQEGATRGEGRPPASPETSSSWFPWYPVIDRDRCNRCRQCLNFCLFGVYADDGVGGVRVAQPRNCKPHCPACARICPKAAIIFPKASEEPINGAEIKDEAAVRAQIQLNLQAILGGDPYAALKKRRGISGLSNV